MYSFKMYRVPVLDQFMGGCISRSIFKKCNPSDKVTKTIFSKLVFFGGNTRCLCGHCVLQPLLPNYICCKEVEKTESMMWQLDINIDDPNQCLTIHDWFDAICLHPGVLATAYLQYRAYYGRDAVEGTLDQ